MGKFNEFIDKKQREAKKHLNIIKKMLESQDLKVIAHIGDGDDPYIFLYAPENNVNFGGVRIYELGKTIAFRIQKDEKTQPFGEAYSLNIEEMFDDLMTDHHKPEKAGEAVIKSVISEMHRFFRQSAKAEKELKSRDFDSRGGVMMRPSVSDYSNAVYQGY